MSIGRRHSAMLLFLAALVAQVVGPACQRQAASGVPVVIFGIDDQASAATEGVSFDRKQVRRMLERAIEASPRLKLVEGESERAYKAELTIGLASERESTDPDEKGVYRAVQVDLSMSRWSKGHVEQRLAALGKAFVVQDPKRSGSQRGFDKVLEKSISRAVELVGLQIAARGMSTAELLALLKSDDEDKRLYTLRSLRDRHEPELLPRVIEMLDDPDADVALEAVGVLVKEKYRKAAVALIRISRRRDRIFLLQTITALGEIGGPVARGFLFTLAAGHDSAEIRRRAKEALHHLPPDVPGGKAVALPVRGGASDASRTERGIP